MKRITYIVLLTIMKSLAIKSRILRVRQGIGHKEHTLKHFAQKILQVKIKIDL